jgi:hypothetical protein
MMSYMKSQIDHGLTHEESLHGRYWLKVVPGIANRKMDVA